MSLNYKIILSVFLLYFSHAGANDPQSPQNKTNSNATADFDAEEFEETGPCSVTCGIGVKEVLLTKGCPGKESKCVVRVEECRGPVKCGWGKPVYVSDDVVELQCIFTNPSKKFDFVWKVMATDQEPTILKEDQPVIQVEKEDQPVAYQCDTLLEGTDVASIKYSVYTNTEAKLRSEKPSLGVKSEIVLMAVAGAAVMVVISIICGIVFFCLRRRSKQSAKKKPPPRPPSPGFERKRTSRFTEKHSMRKESIMSPSANKRMPPRSPPPRPPPPRRSPAPQRPPPPLRSPPLRPPPPPISYPRRHSSPPPRPRSQPVRPSLSARLSSPYPSPPPHPQAPPRPSSPPPSRRSSQHSPPLQSRSPAESRLSQDILQLRPRISPPPQPNLLPHHSLLPRDNTPPCTPSKLPRSIPVKRQSPVTRPQIPPPACPVPLPRQSPVQPACPSPSSPSIVAMVTEQHVQTYKTADPQTPFGSDNFEMLLDTEINPTNNVEYW